MMGPWKQVGDLAVLRDPLFVVPVLHAARARSPLYGANMIDHCLDP